MKNLKKTLWFILGILLLGVAYIGVITPGIPWSTPALAATYCFARSNERLHKWMLNHRLFGPFLTNWKEKSVFPTRGKWAMVISMDVSLVVLFLTTHNYLLVISLGIVMMLVAAWAWRYPGSVQEWEKRIKNNEPVGWLK